MAWIVMQTPSAMAQEWLRSYGGSGRDTLREIVSIGEDVLVAGSSIFGKTDRAAAITALKR